MIEDETKERQTMEVKKNEYPTAFKYLIGYGGGHGENTWDAEVEIMAINIREALDKVEQLLGDEETQSYSIWYIEQMD